MPASTGRHGSTWVSSMCSDAVAPPGKSAGWPRPKGHLARFEELLHERRVRPTLLYPLWSVAGNALGAATTLLGERAAMACTVAVEDAIDEHYRGQAEYLAEEDPTLRETVLGFRDDELAHR